MATNFNYEVDCYEIIQHLAHNDKIDLLVTNANKFNSEKKYMIFSNNIYLFSGIPTRIEELDYSFDEEDLDIMNEDQFKKALYDRISCK